MDTQSVNGNLGPKQLEAANGPVDQNEPEMLIFECTSCKQKFPDTGLYFYGTSSVRCTWCSKFPKAKNERKITTTE
jgi:hypothetical protein